VLGTHKTRTTPPAAEQLGGDVRNVEPAAALSAKTPRLICNASVSLFWVCWIRNTIRKVMMVVAVLIASCQVSL